MVDGYECVLIIIYHNLQAKQPKLSNNFCFSSIFIHYGIAVICLGNYFHMEFFFLFLINNVSIIQIRSLYLFKDTTIGFICFFVFLNNFKLVNLNKLSIRYGYTNNVDRWFWTALHNCVSKSTSEFKTTHWLWSYEMSRKNQYLANNGPVKKVVFWMPVRYQWIMNIRYNDYCHHKTRCIRWAT